MHTVQRIFCLRTGVTSYLLLRGARHSTARKVVWWGTNAYTVFLELRKAQAANS